MDNGLNLDLEQIRKDIRPLFSELRNKSIFITGGTGFFGKWILHTIIYLNRVESLNITLYVLSRDPEKLITKYPFLKSNFNFIKGDIESFKLDDITVDYFIHAAANADISFHTKNPEESISSIVNGTKNALDVALNSKVSKFINISSGAVYGKQPKNISHITEEFQWGEEELSNTNSYCIGKRKSEEIANSFSDKMNITHARCFAFYGPYLPLNKSFAMGNFIGDKLAGREIQMSGDGSSLRSYMYMTDLVVWVLNILIKGKSEAVYNVGSDDEISIADLAAYLDAFFLNKEYAFIKNYKFENLYVPSVKKAKADLSLSMNMSFREGVRRFVQWEQADTVK